MEKKHQFFLLFVLHDNGWQVDSAHFIFEDAYRKAVQITKRAKFDCQFVVSTYSVEGDFLPKVEFLFDSKFTIYFFNLH